MMVFIVTVSIFYRRKKRTCHSSRSVGKHRQNVGAQTQKLYGARGSIGRARGRAQKRIRQIARKVHGTFQNTCRLHGKDENVAFRPAISQRKSRIWKVEFE